MGCRLDKCEWVNVILCLLCRCVCLLSVGRGAAAGPPRGAPGPMRGLSVCPSISLTICLSYASAVSWTGLMVVTHSQETCTRNLYQSTCTRNLTVWHGFLYKIFRLQVSCTRIQHSSIPYKKLACTWLEWWALIGRLPIAATVFLLLCWYCWQFVVQS